jgi:hypothetical protein
MVDYNERLYHKRILQGPLRHKACILTHFYQETSRRDANCLSQADDMIDPHLTAKHEAFRASVEEIIQREDYDAMKKMLPTDVSMYLTFEGPEPLNEAACGLSQEDVLHFFDLNPAMSVQTFETVFGPNPYFDQLVAAKDWEALIDHQDPDFLDMANGPSARGGCVDCYLGVGISELGKRDGQVGRFRIPGRLQTRAIGY